MPKHKFCKGWEFSRKKDETVWKIIELDKRFSRPLYRIKHVDSSKTNEKFELQLEEQFKIIG